MQRIFLALGSNVGRRRKHIEQTVALLKESVDDVTVAPLYESRAVGYTEQNNFLNTVLKGHTMLTPEELLKFVKSTEKKVGRVARFHWGPREIDIDILFYDDLILNTEKLKIPHPFLHERDFVLKPFCDVESNFIHPILKRTVKELLMSIPKRNLSILSKIS